MNLPWKKPKSVYSNAGPSVAMEFEIAGTGFQVRPTEERGLNTSRRRYFVACTDCDCILHAETTGPGSHIRGHMKEKHGFEGEIGHVK